MKTNCKEAQYSLDVIACTFHLTPITILKCSLARGQTLRGTKEELRDYERFNNCLHPYLLSFSNNYDPAFFISSVKQRIDSIVYTENLGTRLVRSYVHQLNSLLDHDSQLEEIQTAADRYGNLLMEWMNQTNIDLFRKALECVQSYGVSPLLPILGTVGNLGSSICGQYQSRLHTIAVQLDVIAKNKNPILNLLDVILHEQVHALIYQNSGDNPAGKKLEWLHETAAITTSHEAICEAGRKLRPSEDLQEICRAMRINERYGELAQRVIDCLPDRLAAWKIWQDIFALPSELKDHYADQNILAPILWERGWKKTRKHN